MWAHPLGQRPPLPVCQSPPCHMSSPPQLPVSALPTGLDEGFFFNSLVVRPPYSSILWQCWLLFVFKFVFVLLLVVGGGTVYPSTPLSWPDQEHFFERILDVLNKHPAFHTVQLSDQSKTIWASVSHFSPNSRYHPASQFLSYSR